MTPVEFTFVTPDGLPVANTPVEIQLIQSGYDDQETGVIMPRDVIVNTDAQGKAVVNLQPSKIAYQVTVYDSLSSAGLSYTFYVPVLTPPNTMARLQDLIVDAPMSEKSYDEAALLLINTVKANVMASQLDIHQIQQEVASNIAQMAPMVQTAQDARDLALGYKNTANDSAIAASGSATAASTSAGNAATSATNAATSAATATTQAGLASDSATAAATSAGTASTAATNAGTAKGLAEAARDKALEYRDAANTSAGNAAGSATAASTSATNASTSAGLADTAKTAAQTAATTAQNWASQTSGPVAGGLYSAKFYAQQAQAASAAATSGQIQADWAETDNTEKSYVRNKPSIPSKTSDLTNDAGFITSSSIPSVPVQSVAGRSGNVVLTKSDVGLGSVDNTADADKPVSTAVQTALNLKAATTYVDQKVGDLQANGLGGDVNFAATVNAALAKRLRFDTAQTLTAQEKINAKANLGFDQVNNTSDASKPISTATQAALDAKQDTSAKNLANGYAGLDANYKLILPNQGNTVWSYLTNVNTAARTYTFPDKNGTLATLDDVMTAGTVLVRADGTLSAGSYILTGNWNVTLPDFTNPINFSITNPGNVQSVAATITTADGWKITTGFTAGTTKTLAPLAFGSKHGWWGSAPMTPPKLGTSTGVTVASTGYPVTSAMVGTSVLVGYHPMNGNIHALVMVDPTTGAMGASVSLASNDPLNFSVFATGANSFVAFYTDYSSGKVAIVGATVTGLTITLGTPTVLSNTGTLRDYPIQLNSNLFAMVVGGNGSSSLIYGVSVIANSVVVSASTALFPYTASRVQMVQVNNNVVLATTTDQETSGTTTARAVARTVSVSYNAGSFSIVLNNLVTSPVTGVACNVDNSAQQLSAFSSTAFLHGLRMNTTGNGSWSLITVSGTTTAFASNVSSTMYPSGASNSRPERIRNINNASNKPGTPDGRAASITRALALDSTRMLVRGSGYYGVFSITGGTALGLGSLVAVTNGDMLGDYAGANLYGLIAPGFAPITVSGTTVTIGTAVAGTPTSIFSPTLNDVSVNYGGTWYSWTGVPAAQLVFAADKYFTLANGAVETYGAFA